MLLSLLGFMGSNTTAMGSAWATALVVVLSADVALRQLFPFETRVFDDAATALAFFVGASLASLGIFQVIATMLGPEARKIDVSKHAEPIEDEPTRD